MTAENKQTNKIKQQWHNNFAILNRSQTARERDEDTNRDSGRKSRNSKDRDTAIIYLFLNTRTKTQKKIWQIDGEKQKQVKKEEEWQN